MKKEKQKRLIPITGELPFSEVEPDVQIKNWGSVQIRGPVRALILPDIHLPYHSKEALMTSVDYAKAHYNPDLIVLNGDVADYYELSKFSKDPRARRWADEIKLQRRFFVWIRGEFPKARIVYKLGNHDERYEAYLIRNCAELVGLDTFDIANVLELKQAGIELVRDKRPIRLGDLNLIHGHEYRFAITNPVNPARGLFLKAKAYAMCSHFHQKSEHSENNIEGKTIGTWSTGCLCELHPAYMPINNWSHGFAFVEVFNTNKFHVENKKVSHSKVY